MSRPVNPDLKHYLGDGVYAAYDGYHVVLTTEDGLTVTNSIPLEPAALTALFGYVERRKEQSAARPSAPEHEIV